MFGQSWADAAGDMVSTTGDLTRFFRALLGGELLEPARLEEMRRTVPAPAWEDSYPDVRYGLGIAFHPVPGCDGGVWHHGGHTIGFGTLNGISANGERGAGLVAMGTQQLEGEAALRQQLAAVALIDEAVCTQPTP